MNPHGRPSSNAAARAAMPARGLFLIECLFACLLACLLATAEAAVAATPQQPDAVDPSAPGEDLPPVGRSLFDHLMFVQRNGMPVYDVPDSFAALRRRIEDNVLRDASAGLPGLKQVLIPLGRSLQRMAAAPGFFDSPRIVLAVDEGPPAYPKRSGMLLKDRLYLGYQARSEILEVISYNEAAGRFEFQLVKDFRPGGQPKVVYANRRLCTSCHQNAAPIFSRPAWDETNANPKVAALLSAQAREFQAVTVNRGVDVPNAIDDASARANLLGTYQLLWRDGCGGADANVRPGALECRAALFVAVLQYRLSGQRQFDQHAFRQQALVRLQASARTRWPGGLALPNPDIPNRDPLAGDPSESDIAQRADVSAAFDPLVLRGALDTWRVDDAALGQRAVAGLADFIAEADILRLERQLSTQARRTHSARRDLASPCTLSLQRVPPRVERLHFECAPAPGPAVDALRLSGDVELSGGVVVSGRLPRLQLGEQGELRELELVEAAPAMHGGQRSLLFTLRARGADGNAIERVELRWSGATASAHVVVIDDFAPVKAAVQGLLEAGLHGQFDGFDALPFRRARLMPALFDRLGLAPMQWCCLDTAAMPPPHVEPFATQLAVGGSTPGEATVSDTTAFYPYCAHCHASADRAPPNFLSGDAARVRRQLNQCAERLYVRLAMWQVAPAARAKTPMPPAHALRGMHLDESAWRDSTDLARLRTWVDAALKSESGRTPELGALLSRGYASLRPCLAPATNVMRTSAAAGSAAESIRQ
jgi:hypothetical protein